MLCYRNILLPGVGGCSQHLVSELKMLWSQLAPHLNEPRQSESNLQLPSPRSHLFSLEQQVSVLSLILSHGYGSWQHLAPSGNPLPFTILNTPFHFSIFWPMCFGTYSEPTGEQNELNYFFLNSSTFWINKKKFHMFLKLLVVEILMSSWYQDVAVLSVNYLSSC